MQSLQYKAKFKVGAISARNLNAIRKCSINKLIQGPLNINFLRNKFESLIQQIKENVNILIVSETFEWAVTAHPL